MKNAIFTLFLCLVVVSCGPLKLERFQDPEIMEYALRFEEETGLVYEEAILFVDDLPDETLGVMRTQQYFTLTGNKFHYSIRININRWDGLDDFEKEELVFHELGHYFLIKNNKNSSHDNRIIQGPAYNAGCPLTIMNERSISMQNDCYRIYRQYYINELLLRIGQ